MTPLKLQMFQRPRERRRPKANSRWTARSEPIKIDPLTVSSSDQSQVSVRANNRPAGSERTCASVFDGTSRWFSQPILEPFPVGIRERAVGRARLSVVPLGSGEAARARDCGKQSLQIW